MARPQAYSKAKDIRKNRIENCQECKGAPDVEESTLQGRLVRYCGKCMEVINWIEPGSQLLIKEVKPVSPILEELKEDTNNRVNNRIGLDKIPFNKLLR